MSEKDMTSEQGFSTRIINQRFNKKDAHNAITMPVYRNASFEFPDSDSIAAAFQYKEEIASHTYSRITNPTVENLEQKIKAASGADNVMMLASGMAAISNTFFTVAYAGSNIVASPHLFGNTFSFLKFTLANFGVEVRFVDTNNIEEVASAIDEDTCAFFCELITNPHMEIADLEQICKITNQRHIPMIVDTTVVPWCGFNAKEFGVDIEIVSTTKYISGGATSIGGAIIDYGTFNWSHNKRLADAPYTDEMSQFTFKLRREIMRNLGACLDPDSAAMQALGMESLQLRFEKSSESAYQLALFLDEQDKVKRVNYTKLDSSPYKKISDSMFKGNPGAMLTFNLGSKEACYRFMDRLHIIRRATNLFDNKTLIIHPESTIYGTFSPKMKELMNIEDNLLRLSVGLENIQDLKKDILQALSDC